MSTELPLSITDKKDRVHIRMGKKGMGALSPSTVMATFYKNVENKGSLPALHQKVLKEGDDASKVAYSTWTWDDYKLKVEAFAKSLIYLEFEPFDTVTIIGFNAPEWHFSNFGTIAAGGISAGIYATNNPEACKYICNHSESKVVVADGIKQLEKFTSIAKDLPELKAIVVYGTEEISDEMKTKFTIPIYKFSEFLALGKTVSIEMVEKRISTQKPNQTCSLIYTSGTTGNPKAVMITHDNICWTTQALLSQLPRPLSNEDSVISYLPLSHIAAQINDLYAPMVAGFQIWFAQPDALKGSLGATLKDVRPAVFFGVPRVWEKIYIKMQEVAKSVTGVKKAISTWAKKQAAAHHKSMQYQSSPKVSCSEPIFYFAAKKILHQVHAALGLDRCIACYVGAAPIETKIVEYFASIDLPIYDVFGQSECTGPHCVNSYETWKIGTSGRALPGTETKIAENGELCYRGRHIFAGYMGMKEMTANTIDSEGWLHSGDTAKIDEDDFISITGRIKELIITAGGENIPPVLIEDQFKAAMPALSNCMVIGDKKKFLSILLTLQVEVDEEGNPTDTLSGEALLTSQRIGSKAVTATEASTCAMWKEYFDKGMAEANAKATSRAQSVQKWTLLPNDFSEKGGEFTPTLKLKRKVTAEKYTKEIELMYA